jgi:hypothetical protein
MCLLWKDEQSITKDILTFRTSSLDCSLSQFSDHMTLIAAWIDTNWIRYSSDESWQKPVTGRGWRFELWISKSVSSTWELQDCFFSKNQIRNAISCIILNINKINFPYTWISYIARVTVVENHGFQKTIILLEGIVHDEVKLLDSLLGERVRGFNKYQSFISSILRNCFTVLK